MSDEKKKYDAAFDAFVEHQRKAAEEAGKALDALLPPEFKEHSKAAFNESVEGFRVLVNIFLDEVKLKDEGSDKNGGTTKVKVEVS